MNREYHNWFSPHLQREMELLVFGHAGARVLVFPARMGRFFDYENWGLVRALQASLCEGLLQLYCVDSIDTESLYCSWRHPHDRLVRYLQYEGYLLHEVLPFMNHKNPNPFLIAHGCSLGAYYAANITLRHPQHFGKLVALSGRYDLTSHYGHYPPLFDDYYDENVYFNTPCHFLPQLECPNLLSRMRNLQITLVVGAEDPMLPSNRQLSEALHQKGIPHQMHIWAGEAHRAREWRKMVPLYL
ncbi:MAG TPA: alpha/beta hydrolase-fold protein [Chthonomonadaceae bacterium]|nr:alpha/beta hydrolase-fold protein [Chthonomonadaceae bacterium]